MRKRWLVMVGACITFVLATTMVRAETKVQTIDYKIGNSEFEGYLAYDAGKQGKQAAVVVYPAWTGITENAREHGERLAELGNVAFVADTYGKGIHPKQPKEADAESSKYMKDRDLYRRHARPALEQLARLPAVDTSRIAAIGYCFGGTGALELARSGADLKAVVVFHSHLTSPPPTHHKRINWRPLPL